VGKGFLPASPSSRRTVRAGKTVLMQAFTVNCRLSRRGGSTVPRRMHREKRILFLREQRGNVYENKGLLWKKGRRGGNVYENKRSYALKAGMYLKTGRLISSWLRSSKYCGL